MHNSKLIEINEAIQDIREYKPYILLLEQTLLLDHHIQVPLLAKIIDDIAEVILLNDVVAFDDVGMVQCEKNTDLFPVQFNENLLVKSRQVFDFDGNRLV